MNRALRLAIGYMSSGLTREERKAQFIVLEKIKKLISSENKIQIKD